MSQYCNLFLVTNLGCEMLYIIHQRLEAQNIDNTKGVQVLSDITDVLLNETLMSDLGVAKTLATQEYVRNLLQDIVSVSIIKIDPYSMKKLWDLMTMIFKWQITLSEKDGLLPLTINHLYGVAKLRLQNSFKSQQHISRAIKLFQTIKKEIKIESELILLRNALLFWLKDFRVNVSLLLRLGLQRTDGSFVLKDIGDHHLKSLGCNMYIHCKEESESEPNQNEEIEGEMNIPELPLMLNFEGPLSKERSHKKIKFCFFDQQTEETASTLQQASISYSQSTHDRSLNKNQTITANLPVSEDSSVHDELIKLLETDKS